MGVADDEIRVGGDRVAEELKTQSVIVERGSWLGTGSVVLPRVRGGAHILLAAGAVTVHDLDEYSIYAGIEAKLVRELTRTGEE